MRSRPDHAHRLTSIVAALCAVVLSAGTAQVMGLTSSEAGAATSRCNAPAWVSGWMTSPQDAWGDFEDQTVRSIVRMTVGGDAVRVTLSNRFGTDDVVFDDVHVARVLAGAAVVPETIEPVTFDGATSVRIPAGAEVTSDASSIDVAAGDDLAVSYHVPGPTRLTRHLYALRSSYVTPDGSGPHGADADGTAFTKSVDSWLGITAVDVLSEARGAVAVLGDSLTDGTGSTFGANRRWTDDLAQAMRGDVAVLNAGIASNLVARGFVPDDDPIAKQLPRGGVDRLAPDVLERPGVTDLVVYMGINDILLGFDPDPVASVIAAHRRIIERAHAAGLRVIGATLTPGTLLDAPREAQRQAVNEWIRTSGEFDAVVDFDRAVADPTSPTRLAPLFDADGIHLTDAGYARLAEAMDPTRLQLSGC